MHNFCWQALMSDVMKLMYMQYGNTPQSKALNLLSCGVLDPMMFYSFI